MFAFFQNEYNCSEDPLTKRYNELSSGCFKDSSNRWGFSDLANSVKNAASSVVDSVKETAGDIYDGAKNVADNVVDAVCSKPDLDDEPSVCIAEKMGGVSLLRNVSYDFSFAFMDTSYFRSLGGHATGPLKLTKMV